MHKVMDSVTSAEKIKISHSRLTNSNKSMYSVKLDEVYIVLSIG